MYGKPDGGGTFIGFEYGKIYGLYDNLHYSYDSLTLGNFAVPDFIKTQFKIAYPNLNAKCYAIIQDVYTSHYANGNIMYGYWISTDDDEIVDELDELCTLHDLDDMECFYPCHNMKHIPGQYFIGINYDTIICM